MSDSPQTQIRSIPDISWPVGRPDTRQDGQPTALAVPVAPVSIPPTLSTADALNADYLPSGKRALCGISSRAFGLGIALGLCAISAAQLAYYGNSLWRAPFFIATLALFHYLEFDMTARFNPPDAKVSSFLLTVNGSAYNTAHTVALAELLIRHLLASPYRPSSLPTIVRLLPLAPQNQTHVAVGLGLLFIFMGQYVRAAAMREAGNNFNHIVQSTKKDGHVLVTSGIYSFSRHPSYFGFFWWGLGTQLVLDNSICFPGYAVVLWKFFNARITKEERFLTEFFGQDYVKYRNRVPVLIPFIS